MLDKGHLYNSFDSIRNGSRNKQFPYNNYIMAESRSLSLGHSFKYC